MDPIVDEKLRRLRTLLREYSYPEKRDSSTLREIDSLLVWALRKMIRVGLSSESVEGMLGKPHILIGEESVGTSHWLYPCLPTELEAERTPQWFFSLEFRDGILQSIERRGWIG